MKNKAKASLQHILGWTCRADKIKIAKLLL